MSIFVSIMTYGAQLYLKLVANGIQNLDLLEPHNLVPPGVFTLDGMLKYGEKHKQCPYFSARRMV